MIGISEDRKSSAFCGCWVGMCLVTDFMDRAAAKMSGDMVASGLHVCFLWITWFCRHHYIVTSSAHLGQFAAECKAAGMRETLDCSL